MLVTVGVGVIHNVGIMMKPKIKKIGSVWCCYTKWDHVPATGKTPKEAYERFIKKKERPLIKYL